MKAFDAGQVHDLADLGCVGLGQRSAEDRKILGKDVDQPPLDPALTGHDPVAGILLLGQAKIGGPVRHEPVELDEAAIIEQQIEPLAGRELPLLVLLRHPRRAPALLGGSLTAVEFVQLFTRSRHEFSRYGVIVERR